MTLSKIVKEQLNSPSPIRQIMKIAERQNIINMGLNPDDLISFGGGWVNHYSPEELRDGYLKVVNSKEEFHKSGAYSATLGTNELRDKLKEMEYSIYKMKVNMENIIIGASSTQLTIDLFRTILDPGDSVLFLDPTYANYMGQIGFVDPSIKVRFFQVLDPESWQYFGDKKLIFERLETEFENNRPKLILIPSPDNPTSQIPDNDFVKFVFKIAKDYDAYVAIDTAYKTQYFSENYPPYFSQGPLDYENLILIESNSKWGRGLGRRLGWVIADTEIVNALERVQQATVLCPDTLHQMALFNYLDKNIKNGNLNKYLQQSRNMYKKAAEVTAKAIEQEIGYPYLKPKGGLYTVMKVPYNGDKFVMDVLKNTGVLFIPGAGFGKSLQNGVRISYGPLVLNTTLIEDGMEKVGAYLRK
jgi:aspartate/methionine/tyrosine aminotransferase